MVAGKISPNSIDSTTWLKYRENETSPFMFSTNAEPLSIYSDKKELSEYIIDPIKILPYLVNGVTIITYKQYYHKVYIIL